MKLIYLHWLPITLMYKKTYFKPVRWKVGFSANKHWLVRQCHIFFSVSFPRGSILSYYSAWNPFPNRITIHLTFIKPHWLHYHIPSLNIHQRVFQQEWCSLLMYKHFGICEAKIRYNLLKTISSHIIVHQITFIEKTFQICLIPL